MRVSQEMLSRSSLETQKLELMSAMSELKLQQVALERENLELRTSHMNNNSIPPRRPPVVPGRSAFTSGTSLNSTPLHGSHNSLQSSPNNLLNSTPKVSATNRHAFENISYIFPVFRLRRQRIDVKWIYTIAAYRDKHFPQPLIYNR